MQSNIWQFDKAGKTQSGGYGLALQRSYGLRLTAF